MSALPVLSCAAQLSVLRGKYPFSLHHRDSKNCTPLPVCTFHSYLQSWLELTQKQNCFVANIGAELGRSVPTCRQFGGSLRTSQRCDSSGDFSAWEWSNRKPFLSRDCFHQLLHPPPALLFSSFCSPPFLLLLLLFLLLLIFIFFCKPGHLGPCFPSEQRDEWRVIGCWMDHILRPLSQCETSSWLTGVPFKRWDLIIPHRCIWRLSDTEITQENWAGFLHHMWELGCLCYKF